MNTCTRHFFLMGLLLVFITAKIHAEESRFTASLQTRYDGIHPDLYNQQAERVRLLIRQAQLDVSTTLGLIQYRDGFRNPLIVRFDDIALPGVENALAYVHFTHNASGFSQELVVNLDVFTAHEMEFDTVFYHEMTHAVLNDAIDPLKLMKIPRWVQEGLATYVSGEGPERVRILAEHYRRFSAHVLVHPMDQQLRFVDYAGDYLIFKYLHDKHSVNALQAFVRELIEGKSAHDAMEDASGLSWDQTQQEYQDFAVAAYKDAAP